MNWMIRSASICLVACLILQVLCGPARADPAFDRWRAQLWLDAQKRGISQAIFEQAISNVQLDLTLPDLAIPGLPLKEQAEFVKPPADYLSEQQMSQLAIVGYRQLAKYKDLLRKIEADYGVPGNVVIAIWGRETDYGAERQRHYVIPSLVTLAYLGRRKDMFRNELLIALDLIQRGQISMDAVGSWSGAMGHTQFEPSDFIKFAVDGDGDNKIDLTNSIPDALASAAKQLHDYGWQRSKRWAIEVRLPAEVSCVESSPDIKRSLAAWLQLGLLPAGGVGVSIDMMDDPASLILPAGIYGPAFLAFENFQVFRRYNQADVYALFVGHLADLIAGGVAFETPWKKLPPLYNRDVENIQALLRDRGYYFDVIDGRLGPVTRRAIGQFQQTARLNVDCWPSKAVLDNLRRSNVSSAAPAASPGLPARRKDLAKPMGPPLALKPKQSGSKRPAADR